MQTVPVPKIVVTFHEEDEVHSLLIIIIIYIIVNLFYTFQAPVLEEVVIFMVCMHPFSYSCISYQNECGHPCTAAESSGSDQVCVLHLICNYWCVLGRN